MTTILLTAVEPSGDALGAALMAALKRKVPDVRFIGAGGPLMAAQGLTSVFDISELSVMGYLEAVMAANRAKRLAGRVIALAEREKPDAAVLIDSYAFSAMVARGLRRRSPGTALIKYVAPQVWGMRSGRAKQLARLFDHLISILPMDRPYFEGLPVGYTFVGHPVLTRDFPDADGARFRRAVGAEAGQPALLVLPGSRRGEIDRVMPPFEDAVRILKAEIPDLAVGVVAAPNVAAQVRARLAALDVPHTIIEGEDAKRDAMKGATAALACSGTVTTELALAGCPMVVGYKVSALTAAIVRAMIKVDMVTLFNLVARRMIAPELIQEDCTGPKLAAALAPLLTDPLRREAQAKAQTKALEGLRAPGGDPSEMAADAVIRLLS
ncbi:MAG: lipid-A-disaccharide synthase [Caulobacteraceae bacterium]